jgi:hypothetical protein
VYAVWRAEAARRPGIRAVLEALRATASTAPPEIQGLLEQLGSIYFR